MRLIRTFFLITSGQILQIFCKTLGNLTACYLYVKQKRLHIGTFFTTLNQFTL
ncbi:hypothetical protein HMPREF0027_1974 [Actinobacillus ureae ATCC 25976]|uniref:Uncharacterized protein n=1 Tax=Actinobacillus ureae ATCC 25976 TaxID=887324 RepID=E8KJF7_9PAST|nr:hypothetical protein HMPREF0027_1974 [Actinobacillus ureae ATCC 25976]